MALVIRVPRFLTSSIGHHPRNVLHPRISPHLVIGALSTILALRTTVAIDTRDTTSLPPPVDRDIDFTREVFPILRDRCFECHGSEKSESGLRLDTARGLADGGDGGDALIPGDSAASRIVLFVAGVDEELLMPPRGGRLTAEEIGILRAWIDRGARWAETQPSPGVAEMPRSQGPAASLAAPSSAIALTIRPPPTPLRVDAALGPIDAFILAELERRGVAPGVLAREEIRIRRIFLDLAGRPPTPGEIDELESDPRPDRWERLVDRLLASPSVAAWRSGTSPTSVAQVLDTELAAGRREANRVWSALFGRGLIEDDGSGEAASPRLHRDLLDWLAAEFLRSESDRDVVIRAIVLSGTYSQSESVRPELVELDPENRWFARQRPLPEGSNPRGQNAPE
jgi:hypothetical protein